MDSIPGDSVPVSRLFDFNLLDDALATTGRSRRVVDALTEAHVNSIGPLLEYALCRIATRDHLPNIGEINQCDATARLLEALGWTTATPRNLLSFVPLSCEFSPAPATDIGDDPRWIAFCKRAEEAAKHAGFAAPLARGFIGALGEMYDNIVIHSERPETGIIGYRWTKGEFEYTVGDRGIGVLSSLRKNPTYGSLCDQGRALELALTDNVSSLGNGRGTGFRQLFKSLANLGSLLRFRSGDHALTILGVSPGLNQAKLLQRPHLQGFAISVLCHPT